MNRILVLGALVVVSAAGLCTMSVSQTSSGTTSGAPTSQPPATQPPAPVIPVAPPTSSAVPANSVLPAIDLAAKKAKATHSKIVTQNGVAMPLAITYRPWKGLIALDAMANGNNPARFIISSGLNMSTVSPADAIRLQLATSPTKAHVAILDASTDVPTASILNLRLGPGTLHNIPVAQVNVISLLTHEPSADAPTCWLGTNWLSDYLVTLDFDSHTVTLNSKTAPFPKPTGFIVPFKLKNGRPVVKVNVAGGGSFEAIVDTSEMGTLIPSDIALKIKSKKLDKNTPKVGVDIAAGKMGRMVLPRIAVGKAELKNLMVAFYGVAAPSTADKTMAIIGMDFLRRFRVSFSYAKSQMELLAPQVPDSTPAAPAQGTKKPGMPGNTSPFGTSPFGTNQNATNPTGTIPH